MVDFSPEANMSSTIHLENQINNRTIVLLLNVVVSNNQYAAMFIGLYAAYMCFIFAFVQTFFRFCAMAGQELHDNMLQVVVGAKSYFFDSNPVGKYSHHMR